MKLLFIKIFRFEFWPWKVFYFPLLPYYLYLSLKSRSLTFPSIVNTSLRNGGFFDENKQEILTKIPEDFLPKSIYVQPNTVFFEVLKKIEVKNIGFPLIAKPLNDQRGKDVSIISRETELLQYFQKIGKDFVIQEFINYPIELAILYSRLPNEPKGVVSSITFKEFLTVCGNGKDDIETILRKNPRAEMIWVDLQKNTKTDWKKILIKDETQVIEKIGNHCRGTIFRNATEIDKAKTAEVMDKILKEFEGFNYGRFDLKVKSIADLYEGTNIKVLELNGVNADAAHIFDPNYNLLKAYKDVAWHWKRLSDIAQYNSNLGYVSCSFKALWNRMKTN
ncbi:MAG: hypothetical protein CFE21_16235 [Bacteroidetes bacterium B1(2017)]|nr:MAG: hypothetical protein CFE21_16235 [Bacteroidetes bacterium B1(2017)]